eukprot:3908680-Amphidinium_carterae.1
MRGQRYRSVSMSDATPVNHRALVQKSPRAARGRKLPALPAPHKGRQCRQLSQTDPQGATSFGASTRRGGTLLRAAVASHQASPVAGPRRHHPHGGAGGRRAC